MFFEMCYPPMLGMQRAQVLEDLRRPHPVLPSDFDLGAAQAEIIMSLLTHNPKERPSSTELLKSNKLPDEMESDTIRRAMSVSTHSIPISCSLCALPLWSVIKRQKAHKFVTVPVLPILILHSLGKYCRRCFPER